MSLSWDHVIGGPSPIMGDQVRHDASEIFKAAHAECVRRLEELPAVSKFVAYRTQYDQTYAALKSAQAEVQGKKNAVENALVDHRDPADYELQLHEAEQRVADLMRRLETLHRLKQQSRPAANDEWHSGFRAWYRDWRSEQRNKSQSLVRDAQAVLRNALAGEEVESALDDFADGEARMIATESSYLKQMMYRLPPDESPPPPKVKNHSEVEPAETRAGSAAHAVPTRVM